MVRVNIVCLCVRGRRTAWWWFESCHPWRFTSVRTLTLFLGRASINQHPTCARLVAPRLQRQTQATTCVCRQPRQRDRPTKQATIPMASRSDTELLTEHFGYPPVVRYPIPSSQPIYFISKSPNITNKPPHHRPSSTKSSTQSTSSPNAPCTPSSRASSTRRPPRSASGPLLPSTSAQMPTGTGTRTRPPRRTLRGDTGRRSRPARTSSRRCCGRASTRTLTGWRFMC